jgi:hypothetical protein
MKIALESWFNPKVASNFQDNVKVGSESKDNLKEA